MSTASFSYSNFETKSGIAYNSFGLTKTSGNALLLTDGNTNEDRSAMYDTSVPISTFTTHFTYQGNADPTSGDGFSFVIDAGDPSDVGTFGRDLGYGGGTFGKHSFDMAFNIFDEGKFQESFAFASGGARPISQTSAAEVDLHNGHPFNGTITYDGQTLSVTMVDSLDTSKVFTTSEQINLTHLLQSNTAFVGFTASTGDAVSVQKIAAWDFSGTNPGGPSISAPASVSLNPVTGTKARLRVGATSSDGSALTYTWHTERVPHGAPTPKITGNARTTASSVPVQFFKDGTYTFQVGVTDGTGQTVTSVVQAVVAQTASGLRITPHSAKVASGKTQQYKVVVLDQFGHAMRITPTVAYSVASGSGTVSSAGLFRAGKVKGKYLLDIVTGNLSSSINGTVV